MNNDSSAKTPPVSKQVKGRLPRYYRYLKELMEADIFRISSGKLAKLMGLTASQIRQDLNCFGGFGQQGYGYNVKFLFSQISEILGVNEKFNAILIGAGNLGRAMASSDLFTSRGVNLIGVFDCDRALIGKPLAGFAIYDVSKLEKFLSANRVEIAVLTLTSSEAAAMYERLSGLGIRGIWNFTNVELPTKEGISVNNVHMGDHLMQLCFDMRSLARTDEEPTG